MGALTQLVENLHEQVLGSISELQKKKKEERKKELYVSYHLPVCLSSIYLLGLGDQKTK
jgi:hypothetical protein